MIKTSVFQKSTLLTFFYCKFKLGAFLFNLFVPIQPTYLYLSKFEQEFLAVIKRFFSN